MSTVSAQPVLSVFEDDGRFFFLTEEGVRMGPFETEIEAGGALRWHLEDEYWSPEEEDRP